MRGYKLWSKIPNIVPVHVLYMPRLRAIPRLGRRDAAAVALLRNPPPEPLPLFKDAVAEQIRDVRRVVRSGLFMTRGSWRLASMFTDDVARAESKPVADARVAFGNFVTRDGKARELDGILGVTGLPDGKNAWVSIINPEYGVGAASWGLLHEMRHLLDITAGIELGDQGRLDVRGKGFELYSSLPEERRAEDYACAHMMRLGYTRGQDMTCEALLSWLLFCEEPV